MNGNGNSAPATRPNRVSAYTAADRVEIAQRIGEHTDALNKALSEAWRADASVTVEIISPKFHGLAGLELLEVRVYEPVDMGRSPETGSVVARALEG